MAKPQIQNLQVFRGFAALAVVVHHAAISTEAFVGALPVWVAALLNMGFLGVDFFFVLSGFIIMHAHKDDARTSATVKRYAFKRLTRIYPAYLPIGVGLLILYAAIPSLSAAGGRDYSLASSLFLIPADGPPALAVAWTLVHELMFYGIFLLFFVSGRWLACGLLAWAIMIMVANQWVVLTGWLRYSLSLLNIEFMFGVGAAWLVGFKGLRGKGLWVALMGVVIALLALWLMTQHKMPYLRLMFAMGLAILIVGFTVREQMGGGRWPSLLLFLGSASYSIYLIHTPLLSVTQRAFGRLGFTWPTAMVCGVLLSVLLGWMYYLMVERPVLRNFQNVFKAPRYGHA